MAEQNLVPAEQPHAQIAAAYDADAICMAVDSWAEASTDASSPRALDLRRDKTRVALDFFEHAEKHPAAVTPADVQAWQRALRQRGRAESTIYQHSCLLSSFYSWALREPALARAIRANPVTLARPKAPKPYQSQATKALTDDEVERLLEAARKCAAGEDATTALIGRRDYALLLLYFYTGLRRRELIQLHWADITLADELLAISTRAKGGFYRSLEVTAPSALAALRDYLAASGRLGRMQADSPLWLAHDRARRTPARSGGASPLVRRGRGPNAALSSHGFAKRLKHYAAAAGIAHIHLHQTRHTFARMLGEEAESLFEVQQELGHRSIATTQVYLDKVARKKDKFSRKIEARLGAGGRPRGRDT